MEPIEEKIVLAISSNLVRTEVGDVWDGIGNGHGKVQEERGWGGFASAAQSVPWVLFAT